ncbi:hypothetical protein Anas_08286, partial [Armadillidium nasatum]
TKIQKTPKPKPSYQYEVTEYKNILVKQEEENENAQIFPQIYYQCKYFNDLDGFVHNRRKNGLVEVIPNLVDKMSSKYTVNVNSLSANNFLAPVRGGSIGGGDEIIVPSESRRSSSSSFYQRSLRHYLTREQLPREENYRNIDSIVGGQGRPSLNELHNETLQQKAEKVQEKEGEEKKKLRGKVVKFGWKEGVYMRCLLNIWGVMFFLRLSWVVGEAGISGIYYMISRSLGPEFGGSIGLLFTVANSIAASTHIIGFVNAMQDMFKEYFDKSEIIPGIGGGLNDVRVLGTITLICVLVLALIGMDWVTRINRSLSKYRT